MSLGVYAVHSTIPLLKPEDTIDPLVQRYLQQLEQAAFTGDIETRYASRLAMATDNSVYQQLPQAVLYPRGTDDVQLLAQIATHHEFHALRFSPRGGGTGTNGQSLSSGIIVDMSRYMNQVLEIDPERRQVRVQAGVIKDQLNDAVRQYGLFFSPELSTSNRATLGGMINTDASGQGSLVYGKTSDHVLALTAILADGTRIDTAPLTVDDAQSRAGQSGTESDIYRTVLDCCQQHASLIATKFPELNRFLTGYDLKHVYDAEQQRFDLTRILTGSEGTLAFITEATLDLTPIPKQRTLVNIKYDSFESALRSAPLMVKANATSVETVDSKVLDLAREDVIWHSVRDLIEDVPGHDMQGLNIVEFAGDDLAQQQQQLQALLTMLERQISDGQHGMIGYQVCDDLASIQKIYAMRKKAVGLLGNAKGVRKPIPFTEDTCVPPEHLADYIMEFRALLDRHQLQYGMFGHVDAGVLHVRPALDMCDPGQQQLLREISDQVVALTAKYGGLMWGEHGKGYRSEYGPAFFGDTLFDDLRRIKAAFDPDNRMNPGKICTPLGSDESLVSVDATKRGSYDAQIPIAVRSSFRAALDCNGNGLCFNYDPGSPMCPSSKITSDRRHTPKGRAALMREWLRQLELHGVDPITLETQAMTRSLSLTEQWHRVVNSWHKFRGEADYSHEVMTAMSGCLACKACASACPIRVDVPTFRARFMQLYYRRYLRPVRDYLVANIEWGLPWLSLVGRWINPLMRWRMVQWLITRTTGMVDVPLVSYPTLKQQLHGHCALGYGLPELERIPATERDQYVLVVQDPFTSFYDAKVVADFVHLIAALGKKPVLLPFKPNGKPQHVKGFLKAFTETARSTSEFLTRVAKLGIPMVGVDPSLVLTYRDEYQKALGEQQGDYQVQLFQEWFLPHLDEYASRAKSDSTPVFKLFGHCTEKTVLPSTDQDWQRIFAHFGAKLEPQHVGCCGMAGTYGHEQPNQENSRGLYALSWRQPIADSAPEQILVTGYSCRSQVRRLSDVKPQHPIQALKALLANG